LFHLLAAFPVKQVDSAGQKSVAENLHTREIFCGKLQIAIKQSSLVQNQLNVGIADTFV
jgi:hypothetical protein